MFSNCGICGKQINLAVDKATLPTGNGRPLPVCLACQRWHQRNGYVGVFCDRSELLPMLTSLQNRLLSLLPATLDDIGLKLWPTSRARSRRINASNHIGQIRRRLDGTGWSIPKHTRYKLPYHIVKKDEAID